MPIDWDALLLAPIHATFGESVTINSVVRLADAVVDRVYVQVAGEGDGPPVTAWQTVMSVRLASCPAGYSPAQGDVVEARGRVFQIVDVQPDGKGQACCVLAWAS